MSGMAIYEIGIENARKTVRYFLKPSDARDLTEDEEHARDVIRSGFLDMSGKVGVTIDPYKAAESILADHYGYAKMVEAHYNWEPGIVY